MLEESKRFKDMARDCDNFQEGMFRMLEAIYHQFEELKELVKNGNK